MLQYLPDICHASGQLLVILLRSPSPGTTVLPNAHRPDGTIIMSPSRQDTHVFILRVWREPRELQGAAVTWRGKIEHVGNHAKRYVKSLDEVTAFVATYLKEMGVQIEEPKTDE